MRQVLGAVARREGVAAAHIKKGLKNGHIVLVRNRRHRITPLAIGEGLTTKINANIGTSPDVSNLKTELKKLNAAVTAGADTVMDLSTGGNVDRIRKEIVQAAGVPVGTVPIYQVAIRAGKKRRPFINASVDEMFDVIQRHLEDGVDFITVHCGVTRGSVRGMRRKKRVCGVVSRGGSMMIEWMAHNRQENPLYEHYDRLLKLAREYEATLSLGDGLRPGAIADATDEYQIRELVVIGDLVKRAREQGVSVMVEGPGHVPLNQIEANISLEKSICDGAPFYVLGPLVTDRGAGHDHIVAAIGGALAAYFGADYLCYVTPSEHLALPTADEVREGVIASKIAAHAADIAKGLRQALALDLELSKARYRLDWRKMLRLMIDQDKATRIFHRARSKSARTCTMCGEFCAMKKTKAVIEKKS